jgi:hypothetical protein
MEAFTRIETARLLASADGLRIAQRGLSLAIGAARCDIECECAEVHDAQGNRWWDTDGGLFLGDNDQDRELRAMLIESITFLDDLKQLERHPDHPGWVRFVADKELPR